MIPALIMMLMRHYRKNYPEQFLIVKAKLFDAARIIVLIAIAFCLVLLTNAQEKNLAYTITRNGDKVGSMSVREVKDGNLISLKLQSDVKTSFIFTFSAKGIEEAKFNNGILIFSSVYQRLNGSEKVNKQMRYVNNAYIIDNKGREEKLDNVRIHYNLLCIYCHEPFNNSLIFSDKYQKFLLVKKLADHHYQIRFPDGSANEYWFEDGICIRIEIDHTLYSAVMELNH
jgi:hypothetical protein